MNKLSVILISCLSMLASSCMLNLHESVTGNGNVVTERRDVAPFTEIEASGDINLDVRFGEPLSVEVEADENLQDIIKTESVNGRFKVHVTSSIRTADMKTVHVTVPELNEIRLSASVRFRGSNTLVSDDLDLDLSSSAKMIMEVEAENIDLEMSSSSYAELAGTVDEIDASISSSATFDSYDLQIKDCDISVSSSGEAMINVTNKLKADANSSGRVTYAGNPTDVKAETSSSGDVRKK